MWQAMLNMLQTMSKEDMEKLEQEVQEGNISKGHPMLDKNGRPNENMVRRRNTK